MRYLVLSKIKGEWTMLTKDGAVLTTKDPAEAAPKIVFHPKSTVEFVDLEWLVEETQNAINAEATATGTEVAD